MTRLQWFAFAPAKRAIPSSWLVLRVSQTAAETSRRFQVDAAGIHVFHVDR